ncbi:RNA polymerase sigma factor [Actinomadura geliboluensis]|uniref:Sigma-70 family RNA polymerase sigma factor n=1 Tax=Actinomadura geliboluensis TaxID=882440 RepID=A0A5S4G9S1_9ACTN|nr:sigma-70 family RNA polymerase sigma factor [Actinomadura geliboluensis]TMR29264.1 sigma-70 family RNA polymerase sigma factor [Actinomadura geliboluensis]
MNHHLANDQRPANTGAFRSRNALTVAEDSFRLLTTGPSPLTVDGRVIGHGLPSRPVDLSALRDLLLERSASSDLKDQVWCELIRRARTGEPSWVVGCVGMAMPGLKSIAARIIRSSPSHLADDIVSELLTEFVAQVARIDTSRPHVAARLMFWARKGALRARGREARYLPCDPRELPDRAVAAGVDPVLLLLDAARQGVLSPAAAELIIATRLDGTSVQEYARVQGVPAKRLYKQRHAAEARLVAAVQDGRVSADSAVPPGM